MAEQRPYVGAPRGVGGGVEAVEAAIAIAGLAAADARGQVLGAAQVQLHAARNASR
jgi:hypothetical protein